MIITKRSLPRRTFLRGAGATLALPLLDAMVPALTAAARPVRRLGFIYIPNGAVIDKWTPAAEGPLELSPTLGPLAAVRDRITVISGLGHHNAESLGDGNGDHSRATAAWLSGVHAKKTEGADIRAGMTIDQIAARELGRDTEFTSLELALEATDLVGNCDVGYSCTYMNTIAWRTPTTPLPMESNPRLVFERLFGDGASAAQQLAETRKDRSLLDSVTRDVKSLAADLGAGDRARVDEYLEAIRDVERRIRKAEEQHASLALPLPERPLGIPDSFEEHCALMFDLQALAFQADMTRVITFLLGRELSQRTYVNIGVPDPHHSISHHQDDPAKLAKLARINTYHVKMLAAFLEKLRATSDGEGSLLDHSLILYGGGISDGNLHNHSPLPLVLAGGAAGSVKGGRHVVFPKGTPMANLLVTLLDKAGIADQTLADSTGRLEPLSDL